MYKRNALGTGARAIGWRGGNSQEGKAVLEFKLSQKGLEQRSLAGEVTTIKKGKLSLTSSFVALETTSQIFQESLEGLKKEKQSLKFKLSQNGETIIDWRGGNSQEEKSVLGIILCYSQGGKRFLGTC